MSLKDTLTAAIKGDAEEVADAAFNKVKALRDKRTASGVKQIRIEEDIRAAEKQLESVASIAAEGGDRKPYEVVKQKVARLKEDLELNQAAQRRYANELREAEIALRKAKSADSMKVARRHANKRSKDGAQKIQDGIALVLEGWTTLHDEAEALKLWGGSDLTINAGGLLLSRPELRQAIENELARQSMPAVLNGRAVPALPGSRTMIFGGGNPAKLPSLTDIIAQANELLLKRVENGFQPVEQKPVTQASAPVEREVSHAEPVAEQPITGPTIDGNALALAMPHRKLA